MYDVAKKRTVNGNVYLYCIKEKTEMQMLNDLSLKITICDEETGKNTNLIFSEECIIKNKEESTLFLPYSCNKFLKYFFPLMQRGKDILLPPPRALLLIA